jgi:hypothetical protein
MSSMLESLATFAYIMLQTPEAHDAENGMIYTSKVV